MNKNKSLALIGFASGMAASHPDCALGPWDLYYHPALWSSLPFKTHWQTMIHGYSPHTQLAIIPQLKPLLRQLGETVSHCIQKKQPWCVLGGDHSCAIATWSAAAVAKRDEGPIGLLWIDAHMDAHTPETSISKNMYGMPVAHLLGYGIPYLCQLFDKDPKIKPNHLCLLGLRSYEQSEAEFLKHLGVQCYFMDDIERDGLEAILQKAVNHITKETCAYGLSIDLDAFDPSDMPGVTLPELKGIVFNDFITAYQQLTIEKPCIGFEIAEYTPLSDIHFKTRAHIVELIQVLHQMALSAD